jgi:hypothetical protein
MSDPPQAGSIPHSREKGGFRPTQGSSSRTSASRSLGRPGNSLRMRRCAGWGRSSWPSPLAAALLPNSAQKRRRGEASRRALESAWMPTCPCPPAAVGCRSRATWTSLPPLRHALVRCTSVERSETGCGEWESAAAPRPRRLALGADMAVRSDHAEIRVSRHRMNLQWLQVPPRLCWAALVARQRGT